MQVPAWLYDEFTFAGRENLDPEHVAAYDRKQDAEAQREVEVLRQWGIGPASTVIDLGAGTGQFAVYAAGYFDRVIAVDPSPLMLEVLGQKEAGPSLEIVRAGFLSYVHTPPAADAVYTRWALHHLPDLWKAIALEHTRRMLRPGGVLRLSDVVFSFPLAEAAQRIEAWCAEVGADASEWTRQDAEEHIRDENSTFTWLLEPMMLAAGFDIQEAVYSDNGIFAEYVAVAV